MVLKTSAIPSIHILLAGFLLLCCSALLFIYYKPPMIWSSCSEAAELKYGDCTEACQNIPEVEIFPQLLEKDAVNDTKAQKEDPSVQTHPRQQETAKAENQVSEIIILVWEWPFGEVFDLKGCEPVFGIKGCTLTIDRRKMDKAHCIMFHIRDIEDDLPYLRKLSRPQGQRWLWMSMESPTYTPHLPGADDLFNLTSSFRRDSDIWVPYIRLQEATEEEINSFKIPEKNKLVCWIISHWEEGLKRTSYFEEFSQYIDVEGYGDYFKRHVRREHLDKLMSSCKFYLSFENSIHRDYITEKVFNPMSVGTVPVVLGPPRKNYEELIPADSFIHVDDFETPQQLAEYLIFLDQHQEKYERFFAWRKHYVAKNYTFGLEHACYTCDYLRRHRNFKIFKNVNEWFSN